LSADGALPVDVLSRAGGWLEQAIFWEEENKSPESTFSAKPFPK